MLLKRRWLGCDRAAPAGSLPVAGAGGASVGASCGSSASSAAVAWLSPGADAGASCLGDGGAAGRLKTHH